MATLKLPTFKDNLDHKYNIVLDGETVTMEFHYNKRADRWNVHFYDVNATPIRHGVRLVTAADLLGRVALAIKPPGSFTVVDTTGLDTEPNSETLGVAAQLRYTEA